MNIESFKAEIKKVMKQKVHVPLLGAKLDNIIAEIDGNFDRVLDRYGLQIDGLANKRKEILNRATSRIVLLAVMSANLNLMLAEEYAKEQGKYIIKYAEEKYGR